MRKKNVGKAKSPVKSVAEDLLIDFSTPGPSRDLPPIDSVPGDAPSVDPFSPIARREPTRSNVAGEDIASNPKNDEDEEKRRKAARRKSLANRRVSFAPEATLHTWSVMEMMEDSTTSSASNSTRRQSSMTAAHSPMNHPVMSDEDRPDRPATPVEQQIDEMVRETPESQRKMHQKKRRRSSETTQSSDDEAMSSPGDGGDSSPIRVEDSIDSESDTDGDTAMSLDDVTSNSVRSADSSGTQTSLDERLRQAATQAGTRGIQHDESLSADEDDQTMEIANNTVTHAFKPYSLLKPAQSGDDDKENMNYFVNGNIRPVESEDEDIDQEEPATGVTMDITRAVGGIVSRGSDGSDSHTSKISGRRRSNLSRRTSTGNDTSYGDETMDLTVAKGGILMAPNEDDGGEGTSDAEMTMEMTNVIGGLRYPPRRESMQSLVSENETEAMDLTMAAGRVLGSIEEQTEPQTDLDEDMTGAMDMTRAVGKIMPRKSETDEIEHTPAQNILYPTVPTPGNSHGKRDSANTESLQSASRYVMTVASDTGSPTLKPRLSGRKQATNSRSSTPSTVPKNLSPGGNQSTPTKQLTPLPAKSTSPQRTPAVSANVTHRGSSPKKLFLKELRDRSSPASRKSPRRQSDILFARDEATGMHTPRVVLQAPKRHNNPKRKSSSTFANDEGQGTPRVSDILSRRSSIGETVPDFQLQQGRKRSLRFEDPKEMAQEVEAERVEEHRRESGRFVMEEEMNEQHDDNTTQNLKEMIESMTPKKETTARQRGRKSLAVGSAKGLLGKRPAELDVDEDEDVESTPKRLKAVSREGSPVKKVHLPQPPTKEQTTGRLTKTEKLGLAATFEHSITPTLSLSPSKAIRSPDHKGYFRNASAKEKPQSFEARLDNVVSAADISTVHPETIEDAEEEKISLQQFLTMTNVHFIELSTTKRRQTLVQPPGDSAAADSLDDTTKAVFSAAATTLPLLELYQHATKELKTYISSGRKIIRAIEAETLADQPAVFKKYVDARPEQKSIMDNQFRNAKTNARLQSKTGWYSWRSQLVDGLRSGLEGIKLDLDRDQETLSSQQDALASILPLHKTKKQDLDQQLNSLRKRLSDCENLDHETLKTKREELAVLDEKVSEKTAILERLQQQMKEKDEVLAQASELRQEMNDQIDEALRVQEEQRRWHPKDIAASRSRVARLEEDSGWKLLTVDEDSEQAHDLGIALTLRFRDQLRLFFHPAAFQTGSEAARRRSGRNSRSVSGPHAPISLTYSPDEDDESRPTQLPTELRFFLQLLQSQLHAFTVMPRGAVSSQILLKTVSNGWKLAQEIAREIEQLKSLGVVHVSIRGDEKLAARLMLMRPDRSRIDIEFTVTTLVLNGGEISSSTAVTASPVYGSLASLMDVSKTRKVQHALGKEVESKEVGTGSWRAAVCGLDEWLRAQEQARSLDKQEASKAKAGSSQPSAIPQPKQQRATTQSPQRSEAQLTNTNNVAVSTTPKVPPRSPLAPRTTNTRIQKKTLPVPKKSFNFSASQSQSIEPSTFSTSVVGRDVMQQKENILSASTSKWNNDDGKLMANLADDVFGGSQPAITPEMQEAMMHTPLRKRVGALRRSPI